MGILRGVGVVFVSVLLLFSLFFMSLFLVMTHSLEYSNVKYHMSESLSEVLNGEYNVSLVIEQVYPSLVLECNNSSSVVFSNIDLPSDSMKGVSVSCEKVLEGPSFILPSIIDSTIDSVYYDEYNCGFFDCFDSGSPFVFVSEHARDYWSSKFYLLLIISLVFAFLLFLAVEKKSNFFFISGVLFILVSLPFSKMDSFIIFILNTFSGFFGFIGLFGSVITILAELFSGSYKLFLFEFILGFVLILTGIFFKFVSIGLFISKISSKFKGSETSEKTPFSKSISEKIVPEKVEVKSKSKEKKESPILNNIIKTKKISKKVTPESIENK